VNNNSHNYHVVVNYYYILQSQLAPLCMNMYRAVAAAVENSKFLVSAVFLVSFSLEEIDRKIQTPALPKRKIRL